MSSDHQDEMPTPPDLSALFDEQSESLKAAQAKAQSAFSVFAERDELVGKLTETYNKELMTVFTIAKGVTTPPTALAAVPPVLMAANAAFAQMPVTEQAALAKMEAAFTPFKNDSKREA